MRERVQFGLAAAWPPELPLIQSAGGKPDANAVVNQHLHAVGAALGEQVRVVRMRGAEHLDHTGQHGIETSPHIQRSTASHTSSMRITAAT